MLGSFGEEMSEIEKIGFCSCFIVYYIELEMQYETEGGKKHILCMYVHCMLYVDLRMHTKKKPGG